MSNAGGGPTVTIAAVRAGFFAGTDPENDLQGPGEVDRDDPAQPSYSELRQHVDEVAPIGRFVDTLFALRLDDFGNDSRTRTFVDVPDTPSQSAQGLARCVTVQHSDECGRCLFEPVVHRFLVDHRSLLKMTSDERAHVVVQVVVGPCPKSL